MSEYKLLLSGMLLLNEEEKILLLHKINHNHYETPGGKVEQSDYSNNDERQAIKNCALREMREEIGDGINISEPKYFGSAELTIPDGREALAHKFAARILSGEPKLMEPDSFDGYAMIPLSDLDKYSLSPDLTILLPKLKETLLKFI